MLLHANMGLGRLPKATPNSRWGTLVSAAPLPTPDVYELEYKYWPWGELIEWTARWVSIAAPPNARIIDYMCGTGFLLSRIREYRSDVTLIGCDIHEPFVSFAHAHHSSIEVHHADALTFDQGDNADITLCTAGLHHLTFDQQATFLHRLASELLPSSLLVIGEEAIREYTDEHSRRLAALRFNADLIAYGLTHDWPRDMIDSAIEVLKNDLMSRGEYKRSIGEWRTMIAAHFNILQTETVWSPDEGGGDVLFVCKTLPNSK